MHFHDPLLDESEPVIETLPIEIRLVGVPADPDLGMVGEIHDPGDVRQIAGAGAMHLESDHLPEGSGKLPQFPQGPADLFQGLDDGHGLRQAVGANLHARGSDVVGQLEVLLGGFDILLQLGRVGGVVVEGTAQAVEFHPGIREPFLHFGPLGGGEVHLDLVRVGRPQFHPLKTGGLAVLDDGGDVPVLAQIVRHHADLHG